MIPLTMILSNESVSKPKQKTKTGALMGLLQSCGWVRAPFLDIIISWLGLSATMFAFQ